MPDTLLEPELAPHYEEWRQDQGPEANARILQHLQPTIDKAITAHVGASNPLLVSKARRMALQGLRTYDPGRGRLQTHLFNQLQGLKRVNRQQTTVLRVPERVSLDRYHLENHTQELRDTLGRDPTDAELADHTGFSPRRIKKVRSYHPAVAEGALEGSEGQVPGGVRGPWSDKISTWHQLVYDDLSGVDKLIMEHSLGMGGKKVLPNHEIASKINRSPGLVSQRKKVIQDMLDRGEQLSPF